MKSHRQTLGRIWSAAASGVADHRPRRRFGIKLANRIDSRKALSPLRSASAVQTILLLLLALSISARAQTNSPDPFKLAPPLPLMSPTFWELYHWWIIIGTYVAVMAIGLLLWIALKAKPLVVIPPGTVARDALGKLAGQPEDGACLSLISQIVRHYFIAAFRLPDREMTTAEITNILALNDAIGVDLGSRVSHFLLECDRRKFAPQPPSASGAVQHALELVNLGESRRNTQPISQQPR